MSLSEYPIMQSCGNAFIKFYNAAAMHRWAEHMAGTWVNTPETGRPNPRQLRVARARKDMSRGQDNDYPTIAGNSNRPFAQWFEECWRVSSEGLYYTGPPPCMRGIKVIYRHPTGSMNPPSNYVREDTRWPGRRPKSRGAQAREEGAARQYGRTTWPWPRSPTPHCLSQHFRGGDNVDITHPCRTS